MSLDRHHNDIITADVKYLLSSWAGVWLAAVVLVISASLSSAWLMVARRWTPTPETFPPAVTFFNIGGAPPGNDRPAAVVCGDTWQTQQNDKHVQSYTQYYKLQSLDTEGWALGGHQVLSCLSTFLQSSTVGCITTIVHQTILSSVALSASSKDKPVHLFTLSRHVVRGLPLAHFPGIVLSIISLPKSYGVLINWS